jgi:O-antigen/teichoic acid export membrane protein
VRNYIKDIGKHSAIYTISSFFTKAIGIILIPIYTRFLTPDDYGIISIVVPLVQAFVILFSFGMPSTTSRFHFDFIDRSEEQKNFFGTVILFMSILGFTLSVLFSIFGKPLFMRIFPGIDFYPYIILSIWIAFFMLVYNFKLAILRVRNMSLSYGLFSVLKFTGIVAMTIITVVHFGMGALGRVFSEFIIVLLIFIVVWFLVLKDINFRIVTSHLKAALKYALPVIPHTFSGIILSLAAKYFLNLYQGLSSAGLYNIGFLIASIMNLIVYSINLSWAPFFMKLASEKKDEARHIVSQLTTYYVLFVFFIGLGLALFSKEIVVILTTKEYYAATAIVPILTFQYLLTGMNYMMINKIVFVKKAVKFIPLLTISSAGFNILMNYILIPVYGVTGAAWSSVISTAFLLVFAFFVSQKVYHIKYEYIRILLIFITTFILFAANHLLGKLEIHLIYSLLIKVLLLSSYLVLLLLMGFFRISEIENLKDIYNKVRKRYL